MKESDPDELAPADRGRRRLTSADLVRMIRARHEAKAGWVVFEEAPNGTGYHAARYCDALALQTWPSRGLSAIGFEVKVDRADVVRELREPRKADAFQRWCERWWLVVPDATLVDGLALPETWGVMVVRKGKLAVHVEAPALAPETWGKPFVAALARSMVDGLVPRRELDEARQLSEEAIRARVESAVEADRLQRGGAVAELAALKERIAAFQAASGVDLLARWARGAAVGEAVALVLRLLDDKNRLDAFTYTLSSLDDAVGRLRELHTTTRDLLTPAAGGAT